MTTKLTLFCLTLAIAVMGCQGASAGLPKVGDKEAKPIPPGLQAKYKFTKPSPPTVLTVGKLTDDVFQMSFSNPLVVATDNQGTYVDMLQPYAPGDILSTAAIAFAPLATPKVYHVDCDIDGPGTLAWTTVLIGGASSPNTPQASGTADIQVVAGRPHVLFDVTQPGGNLNVVLTLSIASLPELSHRVRFHSCSITATS